MHFSVHQWILCWFVFCKSFTIRRSTVEKEIMGPLKEELNISVTPHQSQQ